MTAARPSAETAGPPARTVIEDQEPMGGSFGGRCLGADLARLLEVALGELEVGLDTSSWPKEPS